MRIFENRNNILEKDLKKEEKIADQYLRSRGFNNIVYEPDGNVPPDFLINNEIAIEVRRLNQHLNINGTYEPLENLEFDLLPRFTTLLKSYRSIPFDKSAFVNIEFSRPMNSTKDIVRIIKEKLDDHLKNIHEAKSYQISKKVKIEIFPATEKLDSPYIPAFQEDNDGGGFIVGNVYDSLKLIIAEKQRKIEPYRSKYNYWWLALVDYIGYGIDKNDLEQLKEVIDFEYLFDRIIFISPTTPEKGIELLK